MQVPQAGETRGWGGPRTRSMLQALEPRASRGHPTSGTGHRLQWEQKGLWPRQLCSCQEKWKHPRWSCMWLLVMEPSGSFRGALPV